MLTHRIYYQLKPFIPRPLQIFLRRRISPWKRKAYQHIWPIDERAGNPPENWFGWPEGKKFALVLTHDVEAAKGLERCRQLAELEEKVGFRSSFNFVPKDYDVPPELRAYLISHGFEVGVHGLHHKGNLFKSRDLFQRQAIEINHYVKEWGAVGFRTPSLYHNLHWIGQLNIEYDSSTFDTDPFEPQPDAAGTIFPFWVKRNSNGGGYVELPYTLPQDHTLFAILQEKNIELWKKKLDWVAECGGMALLITHPDYISLDSRNMRIDEYPVEYYKQILEYIKTRYDGQYWHALPMELARFWRENYRNEIKDQVDFKRSDNGMQTKPFNREMEQLRNKTAGKVNIQRNKKIWIDLDNTPHVPFFKPIIKELKKEGYSIIVTARDCSQTCGLADFHGMEYKRIGRHHGKNKILKLSGLVLRALQLMPTIRREKPLIAISHGSRAQLILASLLGLPSIELMDYEFVKMVPFAGPDWLIIPEVVSESKFPLSKDRIRKFPGIKEDVYVPYFQPDPEITNELEINGSDSIVTIRPPATEAHYFVPESEELFEATMEFLLPIPNTKLVLLPRNKNQEESIRQKWSTYLDGKKIVIPSRVLDGLNILWHSDLVVSGGGTMNREAAALGVPVYSIFRGEIGAVDRYLSKQGRLVLIESAEDLKRKIVLSKRKKDRKLSYNNLATLNTIIEEIIKIIDGLSFRDKRFFRMNLW